MNVYIINVRDLLWMCQQYLFKITKRSATRHCSDDSGDIIRAWKNTADNIRFRKSRLLQIAIADTKSDEIRTIFKSKTANCIAMGTVSQPN